MSEMIGRVLLRLAFFVTLIFLHGCSLHQSIGASTGAYLDPVSGKDFVHISNDKWDSANEALIYFYRPSSQWANDELESPDFYIDGQHYFNLRSGSYTWLAVYPGKRHIVIRRPLLGLEGLGSFNLDKIADLYLPTKAGHIYYLRYSEVGPPKMANPDLSPKSPLAKGDLQEVTHDYAMTEIIHTHFLTPDMMAPNKGARSIVAHDRQYDYEHEKARLEKEKKQELVQMQKQGFWRKSPWYWPFGGGPTREPEAQRKLQALEKEHQQYLRQQEAKHGGSWFSWVPFIGSSNSAKVASGAAAGASTTASSAGGETAYADDTGVDVSSEPLTGEAYEKRKAQLEQQREAELKQMKQQGFWRKAPWYWPFGGEPTREPEAQRKLQALEQAHKAAEAKSGGSSWLSWLPF